MTHDPTHIEAAFVAADAAYSTDTARSLSDPKYIPHTDRLRLAITDALDALTALGYRHVPPDSVVVSKDSVALLIKHLGQHDSTLAGHWQSVMPTQEGQ